MATALITAAALLADAFLGEFRRGHPLVAFGRLAGAVARRWNRDTLSVSARRGMGIAAVGLLVGVPAVAVIGAVQWPGGWLIELVILYFALGLRSLADHARRVSDAMAAGDLSAARNALGMMVSRDTAHLDEARVAAGTIESVLENGSDAVFGALFWFLVAGAPGVVVYRLVNTLDAMWGYRTPELAAFGWAAARLDDALNWLPARLTVLTYAVLGGRPGAALRCARVQGPRSESPNAGPVMAAGAGALGVRLGGPGRYHGGLRWRPRFGIGQAPTRRDIARALRLVQFGAVLWALVALLVGWWLCSDMAVIWAR